MANNDWELLKRCLSSDAPIKLIHTEKSGRGIFATQKIGANEIIFEETPLVSGPSQKLGQGASQFSGKCLFCSGCSSTLTPIEIVGK